MIKIKKASEPVSDDDGFRILVDSTWPVEFSRDELKINAWFKEIAAEKNTEEYLSQLKKKIKLIKHLKLLERVKKQLTLVYWSEKKGNVLILKNYLDGKSRVIRSSVGRIHG
ncbi:DUF488 family protein [Methanobacterium alcaliphilum]|uniref:DUF488 family protein, N3 subclade n=1 Tax=Methanobacterium alcaliphilum TaxID=392018 RepID=UPI00200AD227|nr:DUF488 family protein [Methanobacterium alcaliphilum]MCK9151026.1 hypothetical protein [Methanobacterium alcaliphilum]